MRMLRHLETKGKIRCGMRAQLSLFFFFVVIRLSWARCQTVCAPKSENACHRHCGGLRQDIWRWGQRCRHQGCALRLCSSRGNGALLGTNEPPAAAGRRSRSSYSAAGVWLSGAVGGHLSPS